MKTGSLFSCVGGLDLAALAVLGGEVAWHAEIDPAGSKVLAAHWPGVPNLGDVSKVDFASVEPIELLTLGFPCMDLSLAGAGAGLGPGTRSGLWSEAARAIQVLRPELVLIENVRGLLSARADSDVEPCPWCLGERGGVDQQPVLRALGAVLGDLASLGFDAEWVGLPASEIGACHQRFRVFILAWPAPDSDGVGRERNGRPRHGRTGSADRGLIAADTAGTRRDAARDVGKDGEASVRPRQTEPGRRDRPPSDSFGEGLGAGNGLSGPGRSPLVGDSASVASNSGGIPVGQQPAGEPGGGSAAVAGLSGGTVPELVWGIYEPAIRRWERLIGRSAPAPTVTGTRGGQQLSAVFVEFMMGLPVGWVTDVPGVTRNEALRLLGGMVVPQQGAAALRELLARTESERRRAA